MCNSIQHPTKFDVLIAALKDGLSKMHTSGAARKAVIFVENRLTLQHLQIRLLEASYSVCIYGKPGTLEEFKGKTQIMLATDKASERPDLSFCSLVINYDLPWNAQKLEQRISRCHRYGQKHDVPVINLIDPANRSDKRIYAVLNKKLRLFDQTFGASETLLGTLGEADHLRTKTEIAQEQAAYD